MTTETEKTSAGRQFGESQDIRQPVETAPDVAEGLAKALELLEEVSGETVAELNDKCGLDNDTTTQTEVARDQARAALAAYEAGKGETREADHRVTAFLNRVADFTRDGEITPDYPDGYDLSGDAAVDDLAWCINEARDIVGRPPEQH